jgi:hypothetical protein
MIPMRIVLNTRNWKKMTSSRLHRAVPGTRPARPPAFPWPRLILCLALAAALLGASPSMPQAMAEASAKETSLGKALGSVDYLFQVMDQAGDPDPFRIRGLLDFVRGNSGTLSGSELESRNRSTGIYYRFEIDAPLERVLGYLYHPEIPRGMVMPSSIRLGVRSSIRKILPAWQEMDESTRPMTLIRSEDYEENTPDLTTGGYYGYTSLSMVVMLAHEGERFLLSVSRQKEPSTVGRKGVVIGKDQDWNYFYSSEEGLTRNGLGWVNSTIYDSYSVSVLHQVGDSAGPKTRQDMFIWKRAGWSGLNMVKAHHIDSGCRRYAQGMKSVLESPGLPAPEELASMSRTVNGLSEAELRRSLTPYAQRLEQISAEDPVLSRREFQALLHNGRFLEAMDREELTALLLTEQLKVHLGKPSLLSRGSRLTQAAPAPDPRQGTRTN